MLAWLAAAAGPLRRVMAAVAARLLDARAHDRLLFARLSDYAREQPGMSSRQLQELARVHRALAGLPALEWVLVSNALPWSKVRLLVRVASADDEAEWIARARGMPTRELERQVCAHARAAGTGVTEEDDEPRRRVSVRVSPALKQKWLAVRELAERVAGARLSAGDVLEMVVAEAFSAFGVEGSWEQPFASGDRGSLAADAWDDTRAGPRAPGRGIPEEVLALARGLDDANAHELDRRLRRAVQLEQTLDATMGPLLRVVTCAEYVWEGDYRPLSAYASDELGMSVRKARALMRIERVSEVCPELREAYRAGRLSWVKAQCLLPLLSIDIPGDWRRAWVAWAERVTVRRLAADVERALLLRAGTTFAWARCESHPERVQDPIPAEETERERQVCAVPIDLEATQELEFRVPVDVAVLFVGVCRAVRARLRVETGSVSRPLFESEVFEALLDHALAVWSQRVPGSPRPDPVIERDGYRCVVPGCTSRRNLHDHHVVFRSAGGSDALANRVTLCAYHHQRGVHAGRMRVRGRAPDGLEFELPTGRYASGDVRVADEPAGAARAA